MKNVVRGCIFAAPFFLTGPAVAQDDGPPRLDVIACIKAVDDLEQTMRSQLQRQCVSTAANYCDALASGPPLACIEDLTESMRTYVQRNLSLLPDTIENTALRRKSYERALDRLGGDALKFADCDEQHIKALDRKACVAAAHYARLIVLFSAARDAGVKLP